MSTNPAAPSVVSIKGRISMASSMDMESALLAMAASSARSDGAPAVDEAMMRVVRERFIDEMQMMQQMQTSAMKASIQSGLAAGVTLADLSITRGDGLVFTTTTTLQFDDIEKVPHIELHGLPVDGEAVMQKPFADFRIEKDAQGVVLVGKPPVFPEHQGKGPAPTPPTGSLTLGLSIEQPDSVVDHNATKTENSQLLWSFSMASLVGNKNPPAIRARIKRG